MNATTQMTPNVDNAQEISAIQALYQKMFRAMVDKDMKAMAEVHDASFVLVHMTGSRMNRDEYFDAVKDWWKYLALAIGSLLVLYFGIRVTRMIFRLIVFLLCVAAGFLGAVCLEPLLSPWLSPRMPEALTRFMTSQHAGYALGFLICYLVATLIISFIPRKMRGGREAEKV